MSVSSGAYFPFPGRLGGNSGSPFAGYARLRSAALAENLISVGREIGLCQALLAERARGSLAPAELRSDALDANGRVPPLLFADLVEVALGEGGAVMESLVFLIRSDRIGPRVHYVFTAAGVTSGFVVEASTPGHPIMRMLRARLEAAYPGHWHANVGSSTLGWRVEIDVPMA